MPVICGREMSGLAPHAKASSSGGDSSASTQRRSNVRKTLHFRPSARLQSILSRELVADPNVALLEFVKNSYDAHASDVLVEFDLGERAADGVIYVADNG